MKVALFVPCYVDQFYPRVAIATLELLEKLGCEVVVPPDQTCCGQPMANSGLERDAVPVYEHFVEQFGASAYIVSPSASCAYHVRKHYDMLPDSEKVEQVRTRTLDLAEFLVDVLQIEALDAVFPHRVGLHRSCHGLRGLRLAHGSERVVDPFSKWEQLLGMVEGAEVVELQRADECCGFGGTFAVNEAAVSAKMGQDRVRDHVGSGAEVITSGDMSCLMHLEGIVRRQKAPVRVMHLAEILNGES